MNRMMLAMLLTGAMAFWSLGCEAEPGPTGEPGSPPETQREPGSPPEEGTEPGS